MEIEEKKFRVVIKSTELEKRLRARVKYHQDRFKHYVKKEKKELLEKIKLEKQDMEKSRMAVEECALQLQQERSSFSGYSGVSGYSGTSGYSGSFQKKVIVGLSQKAVEHERKARKLAFVADHLKPGTYELDQYEMDQLELV